MALNSLVQKRVIACNPTESVKEVARIMEQENVGSVLILQGGKPLGIVTDRDLVLRCMVNGLDCSKTPISTVMTKNVECVGSDDGIHDVVELMKRKEIRRIPVKDSTGKIVGLVSSGDVLGLLSQEFLDLRRATASEKSKLIGRAA